MIGDSNKKYTLDPIRSTPYKTMLPKGYALIAEGGGIRGFYSAGVFDGLLEEGVMFPYNIGVSAGACNLLTYLSGQIGRSRQIVEHFISSWKYVSFRNIFIEQSVFGYDYIFNEIPDEHIFFDRKAVIENPAEYYAGAMDAITGKTRWFSKEECSKNFDPVRASSSIPFMSPKVMINGTPYFDGGVSSPIPIEKSLEDKNVFNVIISTRNKEYRKKPAPALAKLARSVYKKYPGVATGLQNRHLYYNQQVEICQALDKTDNAIFLQPDQPLEVERTTRDVSKVLKLYDEGIEDGIKLAKRLVG
jgi:predicted patatin/cPLA2 family phospholipase